MAAVLVAVGGFLYLRVGGALDETIDQGLEARATDVAALAEQSDTGLREAAGAGGPDESFAQVLTETGAVLDSTPGLAGTALLTPAQLEQAVRMRVVIERALGEELVRLLAVPVTAQDQRLVVVVGASLELRSDALADVARQLMIGGPIALVLASLAGYLLAAAALRPVERMGDQAATISAASPGRRLEIPPADDEIARLGVRLNAMLERLESALERERTLVSNASHELRTPLALLKTEIELALDEPDSAPALVAALRSVGDETDRLAQLADDLLLLAQVDSGELPLRRARVDTLELLSTMRTRFRRRAEDSERAVEISCQPDLVALVDRRRVEQAVTNLVENALRHGAGTVRLEASADGCTLLVSVSDEGRGFADDFVTTAFERFARADGRGGGAGLGLAIVTAIAAAHGGTATAANVPGAGASVTLTFPEALVDTSADPA